MELTPELLADFSGHEIFLRQRARHKPECYSPFDAVRACLIRRETDEKVCERVLRDFRPCAREAHKRQVSAAISSEEERRKLLNAKARAMETARGAGVPFRE